MTNSEKVSAIIDSIKAMMEKPALREMTSNEMKQRADRRRAMATNIKLTGGEVREEYR